MKKVICIAALVVFSPVILPAVLVGFAVGLVAGGFNTGLSTCGEVMSNAIEEVFE